jgi:hypothetical protein
VHEVALAVKAVESEKCLFNDSFSESNGEGAVTVGLQPSEAMDVRPKNVGDEANVRTMIAIFASHIMEIKAMFVPRVIGIDSFNSFKRIRLD